MILHDARDYITSLQKAEQQGVETSMGSPIGATEGRDFLMQARIGMGGRSTASSNGEAQPEERPAGIASDYEVIDDEAWLRS